MAKSHQKSIKGRIGEADPVFSMGQRVWDFVSSQWPAVAAFFATGGGVTALAFLTSWALALGPLGIGLIVLTSAFGGALSVAGFQALISKRDLRRSETTALEKWKTDVNTINPLDTDFNKVRIKLFDFFNPISKTARNKRLVECELMGPINIAFIATAPGMIISGVSFFDCDVVVVKNDTLLRNVYLMENVSLIGGAVYNCTIFIPQELVSAFERMNTSFATLTGDQEIDSRSPLSTERGTQP